jgi:hypothetical protein
MERCRHGFEYESMNNKMTYVCCQCQIKQDDKALFVSGDGCKSCVTCVLYGIPKSKNIVMEGKMIDLSEIKFMTHTDKQVVDRVCELLIEGHDPAERSQIHEISLWYGECKFKLGPDDVRYIKDQAGKIYDLSDATRYNEFRKLANVDQPILNQQTNITISVVSQPVKNQNVVKIIEGKSILPISTAIGIYNRLPMGSDMVLKGSLHNLKLSESQWGLLVNAKSEEECELRFCEIVGAAPYMCNMNTILWAGKFSTTGLFENALCFPIDLFAVLIAFMCYLLVVLVGLLFNLLTFQWMNRPTISDFGNLRDIWKLDPRGLHALLRFQGRCLSIQFYNHHCSEVYRSRSISQDLNNQINRSNQLVRQKQQQERMIAYKVAHNAERFEAGMNRDANEFRNG